MPNKALEWSHNTCCNYEGIWDICYHTRFGSGKLCVGYKSKRLGIHYNTDKPDYHEHVVILDGEIIEVECINCVTVLRGKYSPKTIRNNLELIMTTIPDERARQLLRQVSAEEWKKIDTTSFEEELEASLFVDPAA